MNAEKIKTKICIVGAGPAGATTSIMLGKMGIHHVILDASTFPRDKICGDGLDLNVVRVLNHIDPSLLEKELGNRNLYSASGGMRFILPSGKKVDLTMKKGSKNAAPAPIFYVSKRSNFDNFLVNKIDRTFADLRLGTPVKKIEREGKLWKLSGGSNANPVEIEADMLVGADGDHSIVLKHLGERKIDRSNYAAAIRQYWKGVEGTHDENLIEVYFPKSLPFSYFWIFPLPNGEANVGYGMASDYIAKKNINVRQAFAELIKTDPYLVERFKMPSQKKPVKDGAYLWQAAAEKRMAMAGCW